jgi:hypothetical protein
VRATTPKGKSKEPVVPTNGIAIFGENRLSVKSRGKNSARQRFADSAYWDHLMTKYLGVHVLPKWDIRPSTDAILIWMDRVGVTEPRFVRVFGVSPAEFCQLNKDWPLRAVIGLLLEIKYTDRKKPAIG